MFKRLMALLLILCLAGGAALAANAPIDEETWRQIEENLENDLAHPVPEAYRVTVEPGDWHAAGAEKNTITLLVMGTDAQDASQQDGQAEVVMVCAVDLKTGAIRLLSLPQDAYVQAGGLPGQVWLKYVHCFGGPELMVQAVNDALGLPVTRYCAVNLHSFVETLDQLGGVNMTLSAYEAGALGLTPGENQLTGQQALAYVKLTGESDRQTRARTLLSALARQVMSGLSFRTVTTLLNFVITAIDTNLTYDNLMDIVFAVLGSAQGPSISAQGVSSLGGNAAEYSHAFLYGE